MKSRRVYRDPTKVYRDLYYVLTYYPPEMYKSYFQHTKDFYLREHICGIGFYSRYHARHVISQSFGQKALLYIHITRGDKLIKSGITTIPKKYNDRIFINSRYTRWGDRKLRRWIYPPEFNYDKHRRRHFVIYLTRTAEEQGVKAFDRKYKRYFNGYRTSVTIKNYLRKKRDIYYQFLKQYRIMLGLPENGVNIDYVLLHKYRYTKSETK